MAKFGAFSGKRGGMGGMGGGNMQSLMKQAQEMQKQMEVAQAELENATFEGVSASGLVKVNMSGKKIVTGITIDPSIVDADDVEMLEDLIMAAYNNALEQANKMEEEKMGAFGNVGGLF